MSKKPAARAKSAKPARAGGGASARGKAGGPGRSSAGAKSPRPKAAPATPPRAVAKSRPAPAGSKAPASSKVSSPTKAPKATPAVKGPSKATSGKAPPTKGAGVERKGTQAAVVKPAAPPKAGAPAKAGAPVKAPSVAPPDAGDASKSGRKGITIVSNKPRRSGPKQEKIQIPKMEPLIGPGSPIRKPLIASGPGAVRKSLEIDPESLAKLKTPFGKKDLQRFRDILLKKRADLVGDVSDLESEALLGRSGSLSALPQHIAEQGSETYEQSLSLNLAAEDRRLIREIDAALQRIDKGTFGICEMTGKAISRERLEELPWTRYSIEAAREFERRSLGGSSQPRS